MDGLETTRRHFQLHLHDDNRNEISGHNQDYEHQQQHDGDWSLESGISHLVGDDFLVEDILDLGCIPEDLLDQQQPLDFGELEDEEKVDDDDEKDEYRSSKYKSSSRLPVDDVNSSGTTVPVGDISDLEWVSQIVDDSVVDLVDIPSSAIISPPSHLLLSTTNSSKPRSSGSISNLKPTFTSFSDEVLVVPSKSRSKRARTGGHVWSTPHSHMAEPLCSSSVSSSSSCSSAFSLSSCLLLNPKTNNSDSILLPVVVPRGRGRGRPPLHKKKDNAETQQQQQQKKKKKKGRKPKSLITTSEFSETSGVANRGANNFRRCSHCGVQKTPQWRAGPKGAKTLCNACGVRYKSGRLLPEYRPAMSPTFLDHVHSNSHRKVLEMRRRKELEQQQLLISDSFSSASTTAAVPLCHPPAAAPPGQQQMVF